MEILHIPKTNKSPEVFLNPQTGEFKIQGTCIAENNQKFFQPIYTWLDQYLLNPAINTTLSFHLEYYTTSSSAYIFEIIRKIEQLSQKGNKAGVLWYYNEWDEDMEASGLDFQPLFALDIELVKTPKQYND